MCITKILTQVGNTTISYCPDCGMLNLWHQHILLCFTPEQFESFYYFTCELNIAERRFELPDGTERLILCTPNRDINFVFTEAEWHEVKAALIEALYLQEVHRLLQ